MTKPNRHHITAALLLALALLTACGRTVEPVRVISTPAAASAVPIETERPVYTDGIKSDGYLHVYLAGEAETVETPESSFINYISYYSEDGHLIICMNGKDYVFANVSASLWENFKAAQSKGSFYSEHFKGNTQYHVADYNGSNGDLIICEYVE